MDVFSLIDLLTQKNSVQFYKDEFVAIESALKALRDAIEFGSLVPAIHLDGTPTAIPETYYYYSDLYKNYRVVSMEEFNDAIEETLRRCKFVWN